MSDPVRLLDDPTFDSSMLSSSGSSARSLLELGRDVAPPANAKGQVWSGLQSVLGASLAGGALGATVAGASVASASSAGSASSAASASSAGSATSAGSASAVASGTSGVSAATAAASSGTVSAGVGSAAAASMSAAPIAAKVVGGGLALGTKLGLVGLLVGGALITTTVVRNPAPMLSATPVAVVDDSAKPSPVAPAYTSFTVLPGERSVLAPKEAPVPKEVSAHEPSKPVEANATATERQPASGAAPAPAVPVDSTPLDRVSQLRREAEGVQEARSQLASGNASSALKTLSQLDQDVPRGALGQERQVLGIEALAKTGQGAAAGARAEAFLAAHPTSPYADRVRHYVR